MMSSSFNTLFIAVGVGIAIAVGKRDLTTDFTEFFVADYTDLILRAKYKKYILSTDVPSNPGACVGNYGKRVFLHSRHKPSTTNKRGAILL